MDITAQAATYKPDSIGALMTTEVPVCHPGDKLTHIMRMLSSKKWMSIHSVFVVDDSQKLLGMINLAHLVQPDHDTTAQDLMQPHTEFVRPNDHQEKAVFLAVKDDIEIIPVLDNEEKLIGGITARMIIDIMHKEHIEDALLTAGVRRKGTDILNLTKERILLSVKSRAPWLIVGLLVGLILGFVSSWFEEALEEAIAIAYFIPVIAYVAGSVGNQTGAIAVRALAMVKIPFGKYIFKELLTGMLLGVIVGLVGGIGSFVIARSFEVSLSVGLALVIASTLATVLASLIPLLFKLLNKDPALGSGPIANAILDVLSVVIYFFIATSIV